ncbi:DNA repair exonuclease [Acuticoccus sediminis]|uniref:DNA repair exonuclease n=1 Tax=Acuticoccus sediminis TaxID=2184697 RepID=A0A8B2P645_9HYPH|nr:DNA repair exonuclease [Acuticoccus sediminis]RAI04552.1 DNA repair exonuclease [Acuticoccus sediminis]
MTTFRFLHAADLHLGSPFRGLAVRDEAVAGRFAQATRTALTRLIDEALAAEVAFAVIAGDVYDGAWKDNSVGLFFNREISRLARAGIPSYVLRGNHDADSVVTQTIALPEAVHAFETRKASTFVLPDLAVALHGQGFASRAAEENLVRAYPAPVAGHFNIGVLHTSLTGHAAHATYAPCTVEDLRSRGYDYWALGHVHDFAVMAEDPMVVFPGNLQGRSVRETGAKGAVIVTVEDGRVAGFERVIVDDARWALAEVDISDCADLPAALRLVEERIAEEAADLGDRTMALRVRLTGRTGLRSAILAAKGQLSDDIQAAAHRINADVWLEQVKLDLTAPETAPVDFGFDLAAALRDLSADPEMRARAEAIIGEIATRLPSGRAADEAPLGEDTDALIAEAVELVAVRARG